MICQFVTYHAIHLYIGMHIYDYAIGKVALHMSHSNC